MFRDSSKPHFQINKTFLFIAQNESHSPIFKQKNIYLEVNYYNFKIVTLTFDILNNHYYCLPKLL